MTSGDVDRIAFDSDGLRALCGDQPLNSAARRLLRERVKHGRSRVVVGYPLVTELAGTRDPRLFNRLVREVMRLNGERFLVHWLERVLLEVENGGRLPDSEAFLPLGIGRIYLKSVVSDRATVAQEGAVVGKAKAEFVTMETDARAEHDAALAAGMTEEWESLFAKDRERMIDEFCVGALRRRYKALGSSPKRSTWPSPRQVPSLRAEVAFTLARMYLVNLGAKGRVGKIDGNDLWDNYHFIDAVYADVLVTNDRGFHRIAAETGDSGVTLRKFDDWARAFLAER